MASDWEACPRCQSTKQATPNMRFLVNQCGHPLCDRCVEQIFIRGSGQCPTCNKIIKRNNFRAQVFEDAFIDKETHIRRSILKEFNLHEEDFATLREYNDYLEEVEEFIYNLSNNIDVNTTNEKMKASREKYKQRHMRNKNIKSKATLLLEQIIADERRAKDEHDRFAQFERDTAATRNDKRRRGEEMLDLLADTELPAETVLEEFKAQEQSKREQQEMKALNQISTNGQVIKFATTAELQHGEAYTYQAVGMGNTFGPPAPDWAELLNGNYLQHVRSPADLEIAGGFGIEWSCKRALTEAMDGLFIDRE